MTAVARGKESHEIAAPVLLKREEKGGLLIMPHRRTWHEDDRDVEERPRAALGLLALAVRHLSRRHRVRGGGRHLSKSPGFIMGKSLISTPCSMTWKRPG